VQRNTLRSARCLWIATAASALVAATGCHPAPSASGVTRGPIKAVWVTRYDFKTPADVTTIMDNCKQAGFNTVVFQVRGNGTVLYPSKLEPWSEQFNYTSPGFDPLGLACAEAHKRGLQLHAWMNVVPAWRGTSPPSNPDQLYNKHPEWFWYDQQGRRQPLSGFYVSLNPCLPEVREYITNVLREVAANYDVDGIHMDYIRFPNEPPAIPTGSGIDYPRDAKTLALYKQATGLAPDDDAKAWNAWRTEQVTLLVRDIHRMMRAVRPQAALAASVGSNAEQSLHHFRDELRWAREGLIDQAYPMNYRPNVELFKAGLTMWLPLREQVTVVPGLWFDGKLPVDQGTAVVRQQIEAANEATGNFCVFSYASLFDSRDATASVSTRPVSSERAQRSREAREIRRQVVVPLVQTIQPPAQSQPAA
jgi:uncharacterized lipoprotein YddW (UPF0748 family)